MLKGPLAIKSVCLLGRRCVFVRNLGLDRRCFGGNRRGARFILFRFAATQSKKEYTCDNGKTSLRPCHRAASAVAASRLSRFRVTTADTAIPTKNSPIIGAMKISLVVASGVC